MQVTEDSTTDAAVVNPRAVVPATSDTLGSDAVQDFLARAIPAVRDKASIGAALLPWVCERLPSPHSRRAYFADLTSFAQHMQRQGVDLLDVTGDDLRIYRAALLAAGKTPGTVGRVLSVLRGTYQQFGKRGLVNWERVRDLQAVESPPVGKNSTPALSEQEAIRLLHAPDTSTLRGLRDYALLFTFFKTACRCAAIANACVGNVERTDTDYYLVVWEKGRGAKKRQRKALLEAAPPVLDYIRNAELEKDSEGPLFRPLAKDRRTLVRQHLSPRSILGIVQGYAREVGIEVERLGGRGVCTHSLRKTSLTNALVHGAKIEQVQALAGHSDIRTTQLYYQARERDADDAARHIQIR